MKPLSLHDLRRTARTNMASVGISDEVAEEVIYHIKPGVVGVSNKYHYDKEKGYSAKMGDFASVNIVA